MKDTIGLGFQELNKHLEDISHGLWNNPANLFVMRIAHVLTSDMFDNDKLQCIRILYTQMAWPERPLSESQKKLLEKIK